MLCIIVDNKEDVAAFSNYSIKDEPAAAPAPPPAAPSSSASKPASQKDYPKHVPGRHLEV